MYVYGWLKTREPGSPDNSLPEGPEGPIDPGFGNRPPSGSTLPEPPPGIWPPLSPNHPWLPLPPDSTIPPGTIWPGANRPSNELPSPPPESSKILILAWISGGIGWQYVVVDPSLTPGTPLPPHPEPK